MKYFQIEYINNGKCEKTQLKATCATNKNNKISGVITNVSQNTNPGINTNFKKIFTSKIKSTNYISAINQLAVMSGAGISIKDAIKEIASSTQDKRLKQIFAQIVDGLNQGQSISNLASSFISELGDVSIAMIGLGESTGRMSEALFKLGDIMQEIYENQQKFKKAIRYPLIVTIAICIAFYILMSYVVPKFKNTFDSLNSELPIPTIILLGVDDFFTKYGFFIFCLFIINTYLLTFFYKKNSKFRAKIDKLILRVYLVKDIIFYSTMNRFNLIFTELINAGVPISNALDTAILTVTNNNIKERLQNVKILVGRGVSLTAAFENTKLYEGMLLQMIKAGEQSGNLESMLNKVTLYFKARFNDIVDNISAYIEPVLIGFIAIIVVFLALGIFMPMWDLAQATKM
jgi:type II secretion system protein